MPVPTADIQLALNTAVTSRIYAGGLSEALVIIDEPLTGLPGTSMTQLACADPVGRCSINGTGTGVGTYSGAAGRPNIFPGTVSGNFVTFHGIPLDPAGATGTRVLRFTNIRVNATQLLSSAVTITVGVTNYSSLLLVNPTRTAGNLAPSLSVTRTSPVTTISSCSAPTRAGVIRFSELNNAAFKNKVMVADPSPSAHASPGLVYQSESSFFNTTLATAGVDFTTVGVADSATRFRLQIPMPRGSRIWVSLGNVTSTDGNLAPAASGPMAALVFNGSIVTSSTTILEGVPAVELSLIPETNTVAATWEVTGTTGGPSGARDSVSDSFEFAVWVQNGIVATVGSFTAQYAPFPASGPESTTFGAASATLPIPRFVGGGPVNGLFLTTGGCGIPTATTLAASATSVSAGTPVTLTSVVSSPGVTLTGTAYLFDSATPPTSMPIANLSNGAASFVVTPTLGVHTYTAYYPGQGQFAPSLSMPLTVTVQAPGRTGVSISMASSNNPSVVGQSVTFTATVSGGSGSVRFADGNQTLGSASLSGGRAMLSATLLTARTHDIFVFYDGDSAYSDTSARFGQMVNPVTSTVAVSSNALAAASGQTITFTAQLSAPPPGAPAATGRVQFLDGAVPLGTAEVAGGSASLNYGSLSPGSHSVVAAFSGDANWYSARSQPLTVTIGPAVSSTQLSTTFTTSGTTLSAAVNGSGTIQFIDSASGAVLGRRQIENGKASMVLAAADALPLAGHTVVAAYSGNDGLLPGTSKPVTLFSMINAAGNLPPAFAPEGLVTIYGAGLADTSQAASENRLPDELGGIAVTVVDSAGVSHKAGLYYVSAVQVNLMVPAGLAAGPANFALSRGGLAVYSVLANIAPVAPGIFTTQTSSDGENLYLVVYGTGIRNRTSATAVTCVIGGQPLPVLYAGSQPAFAGLDQVNVSIPASLRHSGPSPLMLIVDGERSNTVTAALQ